MSLLETRGLSLDLPDRSARGRHAKMTSIFRHVDLQIEAGESIGIVGESGSGKTSVARTLLRLYEPTAGTLLFEGRDITHLDQEALRPVRERIQIIFQDPLSSLNPRHRIAEIVAQPLVAFRRVANRREARDAATGLLARVGLGAQFLDRFPHELSGGQRQRVGIARAIALRPRMVVADEIVSGLDVSTQAQILLLLRELKKDDSLVFISHDLSVVRTLCDRVYVMRHGQIVEHGETARLFSTPRHDYTRNLLNSIPLPEVDPDWLHRGDDLQHKLESESGGLSMNLKGAVALVTGANRGIGRAFVKALLDRGAKKVYASARDLSTVADLVASSSGKVETFALDITNDAQIAAAVQKCRDVNVLVNNAGINRFSALIAGSSLDSARAEMNTNYFGTLAMCRAFAPVLKGNGGGAIVNLSSILARVSLPMMGSLCASKAACLSMTHGVRAELAAQGTLVIGVMPGAVDTDMARDFPPPKADPLDVAKEVLKAIEDGQEEVYPGDMAKGISAGLAADPKAVEKEFAAYLPQ
jgi:peptide/nickel transport system ATP-binding protein